MRIAIIKLGALGDVVRTTCLLKPLHDRYPGSEIWWFVRQAAMPLLEENPWISKVVVVENCASHDFDSFAFDWVLGLDEDPLACGICSRMRTAKRFGAYTDGAGALRYTDSSRPWFDMSLLNRDPDGSCRSADLLKKANRKTYPRLLFEMLGLDSEQSARPRPIVVCRPQTEQWSIEFLKRRGVTDTRSVIGLNSGAGNNWPSKRMSLGKTSQLLQKLGREFSAHVLLLGGPEETERNRRLMENVPPTVIDAGTDHTLPEFISLVNRCAVLITADSLALHIGAALGKRIIGFFGPTSSREVDFYGEGIAWLPDRPCRCFYRYHCASPGDFCLDSLDETVVVSHVRRWMA